ncbi:MAG: flagellar export chaperone FliS [Phycisphaerae bacterium]|nr:flagellar export chaperone FliS [Phycisphaerae bacterium]
MATNSAKNTNEYVKTKILTAQPEQLQMMLYDGCIRFCEQARDAIQNDEYEKSYSLLTRAENIIWEMNNSMKMELAPETCSKMRSLYMFCYDRLMRANLDRDVKMINEALDVIRHMRETWSLLMEKIKQETIAQHPHAQTPPEPNPYQDATISGPMAAITAGANFSIEG